MTGDEFRAFRPSVIYAGIEVIRDTVRSGRTAEQALRFIRQGNAGRTSLDYQTAVALARTHGWSIFSADDQTDVAFRDTLGALVLATRPPWVRLLTSGRAKVIRLLNEDLVQCLEIAALLGFGEEAISWWDYMAALSRQWDDEERLKIGRAAEERAMRREQDLLDGTGLEPRWTAIEDNATGYDIQSWRFRHLAASGPQKHYIEVKGSTILGTVHLTRQEWRFAEGHPDGWELQVWLDDRERPTVLTVHEIRPHIAVNQGVGRWAQVEIPTDALLPRADGDLTPVPIAAAGVK